MKDLGIELALKAASTNTRQFYARYVVLKDSLFNNEYEQWAAKFPHGNNHGPSHIQRVLEKLDGLLGATCLEEKTITAYELFLAMMAILYHDVGMLKGRKGHADASAKFLMEENDRFIIEPRDREYIRAAVISHSSSKNIDEECTAFSETEFNAFEDSVRPRMVAALVRFADELDEDYRRASLAVMDKMGVEKDSRFFWEFCQRIPAVRPDRKQLEICIEVKFASEDAGRIVSLDGMPRSFFRAFAEKMDKINGERIIVCRYLPEPLRYRRLLLSIKPLEGHPKWKKPREFIFNDATTSADFIRTLPEMWIEPANQLLSTILEQVPVGKLVEAEAGLRQLEAIIRDLPVDVRLRTYWGLAFVGSLQAQQQVAKSSEQTSELDKALESLKQWYEFGSTSGWNELGFTEMSQIYRIASDKELEFLYAQRKDAIETMLGEKKSFLEHFSRGGRGGCIPANTQIETPRGPLRIQDLRIGMTIFSSDLKTPPSMIETSVVRVYQSFEPICIQINDGVIFTPSQPLLSASGQWIRARDLSVGSKLATINAREYTVINVATVENRLDVYTMTTDHATHNFVVSGLVCGNGPTK
jgi:hypothetical protein